MNYEDMILDKFRFKKIIYSTASQSTQGTYFSKKIGEATITTQQYATAARFVPVCSGTVYLSINVSGDQTVNLTDNLIKIYVDDEVIHEGSFTVYKPQSSAGKASGSYSTTISIKALKECRISVKLRDIPMTVTTSIAGNIIDDADSYFMKVK